MGQEQVEELCNESVSNNVHKVEEILHPVGSAWTFLRNLPVALLSISFWGSSLHMSKVYVTASITPLRILINPQGTHYLRLLTNNCSYLRLCRRWVEP